ncbi:MAG: adenine phosphoribosyltransferase [Thermaerobacter sp.]|nr:adenine phosphoribosyltransferase [Thermaerobacter sp.]
MEARPPLRTIPDFPRVGINFIDITPWVLDGQAFRAAIDELAAFARPLGVDLVAGPEARGFLVGAPLALALGVGFAPVRKPGRLPYDTMRVDYELEYGEASLEIHVDAVKPGQRVLVVDDLLATGGTVAATISLIERQGGLVPGLGFMVELAFLDGRSRLPKLPIHSVVRLED